MKIAFWDNHKFDKAQVLIEALHKGNSQAILFIQNKAIAFVRQQLKQLHLPSHLQPEILNEAAIIFIKKIREPDFSLHSAQPLTYFFEIIKRVVSNETRKKQPGLHVEIETQYGLSDNTIEEYHAYKENIELLNQLLGAVGNPCEQVIRLKYIDGISDEEAVQDKLTAYSTADSLRKKRSDCMKKLKDITASKKSKKIFF